MTTWNDIIKRKRSQSDWLIIIANLVPVYGVWFPGWGAKEVFLVYCLETVIIGLFTLLKMAITGAVIKRDNWYNQGKATKQPALFFMLFFLMHYGIFVAIQMGLFFAVSGIGDEAGIGFFSFFYKWPKLITNEAFVMLGVFMVSYAFKLIIEFIVSGEYRTTPLGYLMFQPYGRIFIQQVTVILGSMFLAFGAGKVFILVFALIKIFFEIFVDFENLIKKTAKGEFTSSGEK